MSQYDRGHVYHRFRFYTTIRGFSSKDNCVLAAVNHRYHIWKLPEASQLSFASNGFQLLYRWFAVYLFSEGFRVQYKILR